MCGASGARAGGIVWGGYGAALESTTGPETKKVPKTAHKGEFFDVFSMFFSVPFPIVFSTFFYVFKSKVRTYSDCYFTPDVRFP